MKKEKYPEVGEASVLLFKAFQKSLKDKDKKLQNILGRLYADCDVLVEILDRRSK